jgi:VanZ family protein
MYFIFAILLDRAIINTFRKMIRKAFIITFLPSLVYAFMDEFHQVFVPGRNFSLLDMAIDALGISLGIRFYRWLR